MKNQTLFIELENVLGKQSASETTVSLFNSTRKVNKDQKGSYILKAIKPHKNGVIAEKVYTDQK
jgi:hypothetical protein